MPTVTVLSGAHLPSKDRITEVHQEALYDSRYEYSEFSFQNGHFASAAYPTYPIQKYNLEDTMVVIEGMIYNREPGEIETCVNEIFKDSFDTDEVSAWIQDLDGEFLIYSIDTTTGDVHIIPDLLCQLPLYYTESEDFAVVSRKKFALAQITESTDIDRLGVAEFLRLGYTLTPRTFYENIRRVPAGTILHVDSEDGSVELAPHYTFDFSHTPYASKSIKENAQTLVSKVSSACERRTSACPGENVLLLSGGLDSRGVLGALNSVGASYRAITRDTDQDNPNDVSLAKELADTVGADWTRLQTPQATGSDLITHLSMSGGADPFNIGRIQPFLRAVQGEVSKESWIYSGAGGDKVLVDISPVRSLESMDDLIDYILSVESIFSREVVESITNVPESRIREALRSRLESYPEADFDKKFVHYEFFERGFSWLFEAGDTNRHHLWTSPPYFALDVVQYGMGIPDIQKHRYRLFTAFLEELSPAIAGIDNANFGAPPNSFSHSARVALYYWLQRHPWIFDAVKPTLKALVGEPDADTDHSYTLLNCIWAQVKADSSGAIDSSGVDQAILSQSSLYGWLEMSHLFTLTSFLDYQNGTPVLEQYRTESFGPS